MPAAERAALVPHGPGLVVARGQDGCRTTLRVVPGCVVRFAYTRTAAAPQPSSMLITTPDELGGRYPTRARLFDDVLARGRALRIDVRPVERDSLLAIEQAGDRIYPMDLAGSGCEGATHAVLAVGLASFVALEGAASTMANGDPFGTVPGATVLANEPSPTPFEVHLTAIERSKCPPGYVSGPAGCSRPRVETALPPEPPRCPPFVGQWSAGQWSEAALEAKRLFDGERYAEALPRFADVAWGRAPGSDEHMRQTGLYFYAATLYRLGRIGEANYVFEYIASFPCGLEARAAERNWLGPWLRRGGTLPPRR